MPEPAVAAGYEFKVKRLIKLTVSLCVRGFDLVLAGLLRMIGRTPPPVCVVLYYHAVTSKGRERFARQMDELARMTEPIPCDHTEVLVPGRHYSAVTFDDGFVSVLGNALPALEARRIPATLFIPTGCLGQRPLWIQNPEASDYHEKVIAGEVLAQFRNHAHVSIGSHSVSHPNFVRLDEKQTQSELCESKQELERLLGHEISMFSFPHGAHNLRTIELARQSGYRRVFTIEPELAFRRGDELVAGRVATDPGDWLIEFRLKLLGAYRWMAFAHRRGRMSPSI